MAPLSPPTGVSTRMIHSGTKYGPMCSQENATFTGCPYAKFRALESTGDDQGFLLTFESNSEISEVFASIKFSAPVSNLNVSHIQSRFLERNDHDNLFQVEGASESHVNSSTFRAFHATLPVAVGDLGHKIVLATFDQARYGALCIEDLICDVCSGSACAGFRANQEAKLDEAN